MTYRNRVPRWTYIERFRQSVLIRIALAVCLLLQLSETAHFILIDHEICAEHGEVVHVATARRSQAHLFSIVRNFFDRSLAVSAGERSPGDGHEHCLFALNRDQANLLPAASYETLLGAVLTEIPPPHVATTSLSPIELQLLAPKTSPPV